TAVPGWGVVHGGECGVDGRVVRSGECAEFRFGRGAEDEPPAPEPLPFPVEVVHTGTPNRSATARRARAPRCGSVSGCTAAATGPGLRTAAPRARRSPSAK